MYKCRIFCIYSNPAAIKDPELPRRQAQEAARAIERHCAGPDLATAHSQGDAVIRKRADAGEITRQEEAALLSDAAYIRSRWDVATWVSALVGAAPGFSSLGNAHKNEMAHRAAQWLWGLEEKLSKEAGQPVSILIGVGVAQKTHIPIGSIFGDLVDPNKGGSLNFEDAIFTGSNLGDLGKA
jgi:hypothetical protein